MNIFNKKVDEKVTESQRISHKKPKLQHNFNHLQQQQRLQPKVKPRPLRLMIERMNFNGNKLLRNIFVGHLLTKKSPSLKRLKRSIVANCNKNFANNNNLNCNLAPLNVDNFLYQNANCNNNNLNVTLKDDKSNCDNDNDNIKNDNDGDNDDNFDNNDGDNHDFALEQQQQELLLYGAGFKPDDLLEMNQLLLAHSGNSLQLNLFQNQVNGFSDNVKRQIFDQYQRQLFLREQLAKKGANQKMGLNGSADRGDFASSVLKASDKMNSNGHNNNIYNYHHSNIDLNHHYDHTKHLNHANNLQQQHQQQLRHVTLQSI